MDSPGRRRGYDGSFIFHARPFYVARMHRGHIRCLVDDEEQLNLTHTRRHLFKFPTLAASYHLNKKPEADEGFRF